MKKIIFTLFLAISGLAMSQNSTKLALVNGALASNSLKEIDKNNIKAITLIKNQNKLPQNLKSIEVNDQNPVFIIEVKENYYDKISLAELNRQNDLPSDNPINYNGRTISNTQLDMIANVLKDQKVNTVEGKKVLFITTL